MVRSFTRAQRLFVTAVAITVVLAFLPAKWLRWTNDIANVVSLPMAPFGDMGKRTAHWLRPVERTASTETERQLLEEIERFERLYHAERARVRELEEQLEQLQRIPIERRVDVTGIIANITRTSPRSRSAIVEVNRGSRHGVRSGTIAVYGGVYLVGRVVDGVSTLSSRVEPISSIDLIRARIFPRDAADVQLEEAPLVQMRTQGDGTFLIDSIPRDQHVRIGDIVRLHDRDWPTAAQAMILGEVISVEPNDRDALRSIIIVQPQVRLQALSLVTLYIEPRNDAAREGHAR